MNLLIQFGRRVLVGALIAAVLCTVYVGGGILFAFIFKYAIGRYIVAGVVAALVMAFFGSLILDMPSYDYGAPIDTKQEDDVLYG